MGKVYVGIDIGQKGGLAAIGDDFAIAKPMPLIGEELDLSGFSEFLTDVKYQDHRFYDQMIVGMEALTGAIRIGGRTIFNLDMFRMLCLIEGFLYAKAVPYLKITPATWQKVYFEGVPAQFKPKKEGDAKAGRDTKKMSIIASGRLYPTVDLIPEGKKKPHDGIADALGIAHYLKTQNR